MYMEGAHLVLSQLYAHEIYMERAHLVLGLRYVLNECSLNLNLKVKKSFNIKIFMSVPPSNGHSWVW